jgi:hypothetical protein
MLETTAAPPERALLPKKVQPATRADEVPSMEIAPPLPASLFQKKTFSIRGEEA